MELQDELHQLTANGIKLYAISYDSTQALDDFMGGAGIRFTMLSDEHSEVIRQYGVLNTLLSEDEAFFYGIPFPGFFLIDETGTITDKLFNPHLAVRDGIESILDSFLGRIEPGRDEPSGAFTEEDGIEVSAFLRGGALKVGPRRRLVVRFLLPDGLHIYGEPVPEGMVATTIEVEAPDQVRLEAMESPPARSFELPGVDATLQVWEGEVDFVIPLFASGALGVRTDADEPSSVEMKIKVRYQACDDHQCFMPRTDTITLTVPVGKNVAPGFFKEHFGEGRRFGNEVVEMDSKKHLDQLVARQEARWGTATEV